MFRWCAYCWSFLGEREPFSDFSPTHGLCAACAERDLLSDAEAIERLRPLALFHSDMIDVAVSSATHDPRQIIERGVRLGMKPVELLVGILQPALYEVGRLWAEGQLSPPQEARLTGLCSDVLDLLIREQAARVLQGPPIFLVRPPGNAHDFGLRMVAFALRESGREARLFAEPPTPSHLVELCEIVRPRAVGVSVARPSCARFVGELLEGLRARSLSIEVVVGGMGAPLTEGLPVRRWPSATSLLTEPEAF